MYRLHIAQHVGNRYILGYVSEYVTISYNEYFRRTGARLARPEVTEADRTAAEQEAPLYSVPPIPTTTTDDRLRLPLKEDDGKTSKSVSEMNHIDLEVSSILQQTFFE